VIELAGGKPARVQLDRSVEDIGEIMKGCDGVLLPGSKADVDPTKFHSERSTHTAAADPSRDAVDELLLQDAYKLRKPVLGICYGLQILNVFRKGTLIQHIPDFLPEAARARVDHEAGRNVAIAHTVEIEQDSTLADIVADTARLFDTARVNHNREGRGFSRADSDSQRDRASAPEGRKLILPVNSSHHQSADMIGNDLRIVARCPDDGIIEAVEGTIPDHFVLAVQWHPERSIDNDLASRAIFRAFVDATRDRR
jgi:putative glutamine amidotransferase